MSERQRQVYDDLTPSRIRALEVLAATHPRAARHSNATRIANGVALVEWRVATGLIADGLATAPILHLTDAGLAACREAGVPIRERGAA